MDMASWTYSKFVQALDFPNDQMRTFLRFERSVSHLEASGVYKVFQ